MERSENSRRSHFTTSLLVNSLSNLIRRYATPYPYQGKAEADGKLYNNPFVTLSRATSLYTKEAKRNNSLFVYDAKVFFYIQSNSFFQQISLRFQIKLIFKKSVMHARPYEEEYKRSDYFA